MERIDLRTFASWLWTEGIIVNKERDLLQDIIERWGCRPVLVDFTYTFSPWCDFIYGKYEWTDEGYLFQDAGYIHLLADEEVDYVEEDFVRLEAYMCLVVEASIYLQWGDDQITEEDEVDDYDLDVSLQEITLVEPGNMEEAFGITKELKEKREVVGIPEKGDILYLGDDIDEDTVKNMILEALQKEQEKIKEEKAKSVMSSFTSSLEEQLFDPEDFGWSGSGKRKNNPRIINAKYEVTCEDCGEEFTVNLFGKVREREWKLENYNWICDECKRKQFEEQNKAAAEKSKEAGLPPLEFGTEKQINWAESIRAKVLDSLIEYAEKPLGSRKEEKKILAKKAKEVLSKKTKAKFWIDRRSYLVDDWIDHVWNYELPLEEKGALFLETRSKRLNDFVYKENLRKTVEEKYKKDFRDLRDFATFVFQSNEGREDVQSSVDDFFKEVEEKNRMLLSLFALKNSEQL